ncbi:MAG: hypothetical protein EOP38_20055 [Rubrivivax sp.]|nr:MAG: hypothetical protein EOP38_20055 [Rubrivivax sp.]
MKRRTTLHPFNRAALAKLAWLAAGLMSAQLAWGQISNVPVTESPNGRATTTTDESTQPPAVAAKSAAVNSVGESLGSPAERALRPSSIDPLASRSGLITQTGTGRPVSEGVRVLRLPGKCSPKTNSLDCVAEAGQAPTGANVSSRVRNSVIGEVGAGRAATEGSGTVKRKDTCTPQPGKLTCE